MPKKRTPHSPTTNGPVVQPTKGAYFLSLTVKNIRCFGEPEQTLDLSDGKGNPARWVLLFGDNGTGKTTLLRTLAAFELVPSEEHGFWPRVGEWYFRSAQFQRILGCASSAPGIIATKLAGGGELMAAHQPFVVSEYAFVFLPNRIQVAQVPEVDQNNASDVRNLRCYGYGPGRRLSNTTLHPDEPDDATTSLYSDDANLRNAEEWLLRLDYSASKPSDIREKQQQRLVQVKELLLDILPEVEDLRFTEPIEANPTPAIEFKTPDGWIPLRQLGHGYQTLIAWIVDFASRLVDAHPHAENPLAQPAVVLLDEIDLHLHPKWQRDVMGHLSRCFPNTQFIATAHSPLIAQAASDDARLVLLRREGDHVVIDNDVNKIRGWRIDQVLTSDLFGLSSARPPQLEPLLKRRQELLTKERLTAADRRELAELENQIGDLPGGESPLQIKAAKLIEESLRLLNSKTSTNP